MKLNSIEVKVCMLRQNLRQRDVERISGVSRSTINGICCGRSCREDTARKIAAALGVSLEDIMMK